MSVIRLNPCKTCRQLLDLPGVGSFHVTCKYCKTNNELTSRIIGEESYNAQHKVIEPREAAALAKLPTTYKEFRNCSECGSSLHSIIIDEKYKCILECLFCNKITS